MRRSCSSGWLYLRCARRAQPYPTPPHPALLCFTPTCPTPPHPTPPRPALLHSNLPCPLLQGVAFESLACLVTWSKYFPFLSMLEIHVLPEVGVQNCICPP